MFHQCCNLTVLTLIAAGKYVFPLIDVNYFLWWLVMQTVHHSSTIDESMSCSIVGADQTLAFEAILLSMYLFPVSAS